ncbi:MAG: hypothetical protein LBJ92_00305 [Holosporales bacterium]|jgi:hypothetical protein|nr:hypothetical protein [Holosporales bacterium]
MLLVSLFFTGQLLGFQPGVVNTAYNPEDNKAQIVQVVAGGKSESKGEETNIKVAQRKTGANAINVSKVLAEDHIQLLALTIANDLGIGMF